MVKELKKKSRTTLTKGDFEKIGSIFGIRLDKRLAPIEKDLSDLKYKVTSIETRLDATATKQDLEKLKLELQNYTHQGVEAIMNELDKMYAKVEKVEAHLIHKEEIETLKTWAAKVSTKIGVPYHT